MKWLLILLVLLLTFSGLLFYQQYSDVTRWQQKAMKNPNPPEWVSQSPVTIALNLWIDMCKNIITLIVSLITALSMYLNYKRDIKEKT